MHHECQATQEVSRPVGRVVAPGEHEVVGPHAINVLRTRWEYGVHARGVSRAPHDVDRDNAINGYGWSRAVDIEEVQSNDVALWSPAVADTTEEERKSPRAREARGW